jgi:hypothetical protein
MDNTEKLNEFNIANIANILKIEEIKSNIKFWLVRTKSGIFYEEFKANEFIAIGWNDIDKKLIDSLNYERKKGKKQFEYKKNKIIEQIMENWGVSKSVASQNLNKSDRLISEVKKGDIVMFPSKGSKEITFAYIEEYFEKDISITKELEVEKRIESGNFDFLQEKCPYKKCRKIKVIKTINSSRIHPKLYEALISRHGISNINNYAEHILISIYTLYYWKNKISFAIRIEQKDAIDGFEFSKLMYNTSKIIKASDENIKLTTRINLNSAGLLEYIMSHANSIVDIMTNAALLSAISTIGIAFCGGKYGDKTINSLFDKFMQYKKLKSDLEDAELSRQEKRKSLEREDIKTESAKNQLKQDQLETKLKKEKLEQERIKTQIGEKILSNISQKEIEESANKLCVNTDEIKKVINIFDFMSEK